MSWNLNDMIVLTRLIDFRCDRLTDLKPSSPHGPTRGPHLSEWKKERVPEVKTTQFPNRPAWPSVTELGKLQAKPRKAEEKEPSQDVIQLRWKLDIQAMRCGSESITTPEPPAPPRGPAWVVERGDEELRAGESCPKFNQYSQKPRNRWNPQRWAKDPREETRPVHTSSYIHPTGSISLHTKMKVKEIGSQDLSHNPIIK